MAICHSRCYRSVLQNLKPRHYRYSFVGYTDSVQEEYSDLIRHLKLNRAFEVETLKPATRPGRKHIITPPDIIVTFAAYTSPHDASVSAFNRTKSLHIHVLNECRGSNCTDDMFLLDGKVGKYMVLGSRKLIYCILIRDSKITLTRLAILSIMNTALY